MAPSFLCNLLNEHQPEFVSAHLLGTYEAKNHRYSRFYTSQQHIISPQSAIPLKSSLARTASLLVTVLKW